MQRTDLAMWKLAVQFMPHLPQAHCDLGDAYAMQGDLDQALACFEQALRLDANYAEAHRRRALTWLLGGDFERGWSEYEWRLECRQFADLKRSFPQPLWDGSALDGRTILLHAEQGLGDMLQFVRYAPLVKQRGGRVIVECHAPLLQLVASCPGIDALAPWGSALPPFNVYAPLLSLPRILGTTRATIPADIPYLFADPELVEWWGGEVVEGRQGDKETRRQGDKETGRQGDRETDVVNLTTTPAHHSPLTTHHSPLTTHHSPLTTHHSPLLKIGITWQGNPTHRLDVHRSIPLRQFAPLAQIPGVHLFSLQKGVGTEQLAEVQGLFHVTDLGSRLGTFMDTAAVMKNLNLVISADTAVVHCAGTLGVPVWVALGTVPEWRWLLERADSLWYPTMRLFRQQQLGDWGEVFARMARELQRMVAR